MFFSVVSASPASRRRALSGGLVSGDLAIALHRTLCIDKAIGQVVLECVPAHLASKIMDGLNLSLGAMVLTPRLLPMSSFKSACRWAVKSDLLLRIEDDALAKAGAPVEDLDKSCLAELLHELIIGSGSSGTRGKLVIDVGDCKRDQFLGLLNAMHTAGLVSRFQVEHEEAVWSLTDTGMSTIQAGMTVADRVSMMIPRDLPFAELTLFELFKHLEGHGFVCRMARSRKEVKTVRATFFDVGDPKSEKLWWMMEFDTMDRICRDYLVLLLTASDHKKAVPHLASRGVYKVTTDSKGGNSAYCAYSHHPCHEQSVFRIGELWVAF